jgi:hypothetical protein
MQVLVIDEMMELVSIFYSRLSTLDSLLTFIASRFSILLTAESLL